MFQVTFTVNNFIRYVVIVLAVTESAAKDTILKQYTASLITFESITPYYSNIVILDDCLID